jgi:hypothetical protein
MKRSVGVTAAAAVALLGSVSVALLGLYSLLIESHDVKLASTLAQQSHISLMTTLVEGALAAFGLAFWGLATTIGLLRLKNWSRISILIFSGFTAVTAGFFAAVLAILPLPETPETLDTSFFLRVTLELIAAVLISVAVWWLALFSRKSVVAQFEGAVSIATAPQGSGSSDLSATAAFIPRPRRPLSITILGWLCLLEVLIDLPMLFSSRVRSTPVLFFWTILEGTGKWIFLVILQTLVLAVGIGLLRNKAWALWLDIAIQVFGLTNVATGALLRGRAARWERFTEHIRVSFPPEMVDQSPQFPANFVILIFATGAVISLIFLWFLWTRRKRFFALASQ